MEISVELARELVKEQFTQYENLKIFPVKKSGHDNRTFHLGDKYTLRFPSGEGYAKQVLKESEWLPYLQKYLDYPIQKFLHLGKPNKSYPFHWSINGWIEGETLLETKEINKNLFAFDLNIALKKLQEVPYIDKCKEIVGGEHNFFRGGDLEIYHNETIKAIDELRDILPKEKLMLIWKECLKEKYTGQKVFVHGDIAPGNILIKDEKFYGIIDFGILGVGDPACDYAMAWTYFDKESRKMFLKGLDKGMIKRARGWALWKALITYHAENIDFSENAKRTIKEILNEDW